ncbi:hypothetical protein HHK36_018786 [Tetracentron sinense]|uniref:Uncharacterized protein n=1 Tax=Tetracentron sinense TaxID=13715 RepID=A0A835DC70_TETSI|nr:hypothetical protein HHK36_018786 [Tetracentron sinense]
MMKPLPHSQPCSSPTPESNMQSFIRFGSLSSLLLKDAIPNVFAFLFPSLNLDLRYDMQTFESRLSDEKVFPLSMLEVFSARITNCSGNLYGTIKATDGLGFQFLYNRKKEDYEYSQPGKPLLLNGPHRAIIACDYVSIDANLIDKDSDLPLVCHGSIQWNSFASRSDAAQATVKVTLIIGDGREDSAAHVYGMITARSSNFFDESVLFQKALTEHVDVRSGQLIPLSRSVVSVPFDSFLVVQTDLLGVNAKGTLRFPVYSSGTYEKRIYGQSWEIRGEIHSSLEDPFSMAAPKALGTIGETLHAQYKRWQPRPQVWNSSGSSESTMKDCIVLAACEAHETLPQSAEFPAEVFTSCLTTLIKMLSPFFTEQLKASEVWWDELLSCTSAELIVVWSMTVLLNSSEDNVTGFQYVFDLLIEEEEKEHSLGCHSEKLAISFSVISIAPKDVIGVVKNLLVCGDCHTAIK